MVVVKTEPNLDQAYKSELDVGPIKDQFLFTPKNEKTFSTNKLSTTKIPNSRPYTNNKNKTITTLYNNTNSNSNSSSSSNTNKNDRHSIVKDKVNFSDYILSTSNIGKDNTNNSVVTNKNVQNYKNETILVESRSSPVVKTELFDKSIFSLTDMKKKKALNNNSGSSSNIDNNKDDTSIDDNKGQKVRKRSKIENLNITGKLKKTKPSQTSINNHVDTTNMKQFDNVPTDPGKKKIIDELLFERKNILDTEEDKEKLFVELFEDVDPNEELDYCKDIIQYPLEKWLEWGHNFTLEHENLIKELMRTRLDLSYKFQIITKTMNDRCDALMAQENRLDGKLKQIKNIAKNMLDIL